VVIFVPWLFDAGSGSRGIEFTFDELSAAIRRRLGYKGGIVYYVIEATRWCIALHRETTMRLTYRRDYLPERKVWRDFLVAAEPVFGATNK
jgi:hypothetical protein